MASKFFEQFLKTASPEQLAELKKDSQDLQRNGVAVKAEYQTSAPLAAQSRSSVPKLNDTVFPNQQKAAEPGKAQSNAFTRTQDSQLKAKAAEQGQELQKKNVEIEPER